MAHVFLTYICFSVSVSSVSVSLLTQSLFSSSLSLFPPLHLSSSVFFSLVSCSSFSQSPSPPSLPRFPPSTAMTLGTHEVNDDIVIALHEVLEVAHGERHRVLSVFVRQL